MTDDKKELYQCPECGLHYLDAQTAKKCEAWCQEHRSCNLIIEQQSIEAQNNRKNGHK